MNSYDLAQSNDFVTCQAGWLGTTTPSERIGCAAVSGEYCYGSSGDDDAQLIERFMVEACGKYDHDKWLYDFRQLHYSWGDRMETVLCTPRSRYGLGLSFGKWAFVCGDHCYPAMKALIDEQDAAFPTMKAAENLLGVTFL